MKPLSPVMRDRVTDTLSYVLEQSLLRTDPALIIVGLIEDHGASRRFANGTYELRCAGIVTTNTANSSKQLLTSWSLRAANRLHSKSLTNFTEQSRSTMENSNGL